MSVHRSSSPARRSAWARTLFALALGCPVGASCGGRSNGSGITGSETHFLVHCSASCADGLECIGGVCTQSCSDAATCLAWSPVAVCSSEPAAAATRACEVPCGVATDCAPLGAGYACRDQRCSASELAASAEGTGAPLPGGLELLELRRIGEQAAPPGSSCDPLSYLRVIFVDMAARQLSWQSCVRDSSTGLFAPSGGQLELLDAELANVRASYEGLRVSADRECFTEAGIVSLDLTTEDSARFSYADADHAGCPDERLVGRSFVRDLVDMYDTLAATIADR